MKLMNISLRLVLTVHLQKCLPKVPCCIPFLQPWGRVGILGIDACTNQAIAGLTIKDTNQLNTDYLYYYLKSKQNYVNKISRGVAQNNINMSMLRSFELPLPEISKQEEIVAILDKGVRNYQ